MNKNTYALLAAIGLAALGQNASASMTIEGLRFDDTARLANSELRLNGLGLRAVFIIKGYVAGLYLNGKATTLREVVSTPGPKRLQIRMLREASAEDFKKALVSGIEKNASDTELVALRERLQQFTRLFDSVGSVKTGDTINLDFVPDKGTMVAVNDAAKGGVIQGADFYNAILGIFLGDNPVDSGLKKGLLGQ
ncbi:MAG: chalcone isomerase family protein [Gammaproteobacteria bacterium]|nr:chalcone isomerase family protein [Gammaproteobacteria bacterium]MBU0786975.1 chalcone isomerase family protein [Gammaproteobacteria bacterium]MBU0816226.1 chalcone isomerase family protein [Gammaproteobacteria bacterium]MBU1787863.1 chalcone isomerase family protein [Gammaproteobacteria bacterium]